MRTKIKSTGASFAKKNQMQVEILEQININHSKQWVLLRGNINKPLIIQVQAGPGFPMISEATTLNKLFNWENDYLVAYWDLRGCGKSYQKNLDPKSINLAQYTHDVITCTQYLTQKYHKNNAILIGYSIGASIAMMAASSESHLFSNLILVGMDINIPAANAYAINNALLKTNRSSQKRIRARLIQLKGKAITNAQLFQKRAKILTDLGGIISSKTFNQLFISQFKNIVTCRQYSILDIIRTIKGLNFCQNALLAEMDTFDLFKKELSIDIPIHFIHGKYDGIAPLEVAMKYYEEFSSLHKTFTLFEHSAHMPHIEEPYLFYKLLKKDIENL